MRRHTPHAFDRAVQTANVWLKDIEQAGRLRSRFQAYAVLRSVLHALRDCLPPAEAVKFSAQMPMMIKGVFYDGWKFAPKPLRLSRDDFRAYVHRGLKEEEGGVVPAVALKAVLSALRHHISPTVLETLQLVLPREVRAEVHAALAELYAEEAVGTTHASKEWIESEMGGPFGE